MAHRVKERKHPWSLVAVSDKNSSAVSRADDTGLAALGFSLSAPQDDARGGQSSKTHRLFQLREAKAWEIAQAPLKAIPMNLFMMWMMGSTIQIFTMIMLAMAFTSPIKGLGSVSKTFAPLGTEQRFTLQKVVFVLLNLVSLGVPLYKANSLGLMPSAADWLFGELHDPRLEVAGGGIIF